MERIKRVQEYVDDVICNMDNEKERAGAYKHLYGVSQVCIMLAMKRNENIELAAIAGLLHDIYTYKMHDSVEHAHKGSLLAKDILESFGIFEQKEIDKIVHAIYHHSDKGNVHTSFDEVLKDADVLQRGLYNPLVAIAPHEKDRFSVLKKEWQLDGIGN